MRYKELEVTGHFLKLSTQSRRCLRRLVYTILKLMERIPNGTQQNETDVKHMSNNVTTKTTYGMD